MAPDDYEQMSALSALGLYGVFSHFIHPDDVFDPDRSHGCTWEELYRSYCAWMRDIHTTYPWLRPERHPGRRRPAHLRRGSTPPGHGRPADPGQCGKLPGRYQLLLKDRPHPQSGGRKLYHPPDQRGKRPGYYLVTVHSPNFVVRLVLITKICLIVEGCYPYVVGGVSAWVQMLVQQMPEHQFLIVSVGAESSQWANSATKYPITLWNCGNIFWMNRRRLPGGARCPAPLRRPSARRCWT